MLNLKKSVNRTSNNYLKNAVVTKPQPQKTTSSNDSKTRVTPPKSSAIKNIKPTTADSKPKQVSEKSAKSSKIQQSETKAKTASTVKVLFFLYLSNDLLNLKCIEETEKENFNLER